MFTSPSLQNYDDNKEDIENENQMTVTLRNLRFTAILANEKAAVIHVSTVLLEPFHDDLFTEQSARTKETHKSIKPLKQNGY